MSQIGSQVSIYKSPNSVIGGKRSYLDMNGNDVPLSYYYKWIEFDTNVIIMTPSQLKSVVNGDKNVNVRYIQIFDSTIESMTAQISPKQVIRVIASKQRNNYDATGQQTKIIGYLTYDKVKSYMQGECQQFDMDSRDDVKLSFEIRNTATNAWTAYNLPDTTCYVYLDIEIQYDYNSNN